MTWRWLRTALFALIPLVPALEAAAAGPPDTGTPALVRLTYDPVRLPGNERLDLAGANLLLAATPWLHSGIGVYGAVGGRRGGFFTGGIETGVRKRLAGPLLAEGGVFLGGGGGGGAPQGSGLMIRPHAGLIWETGYGNFGIGAATVWFPDGEIGSTHVTASWENPLEIAARSGWTKDSAAFAGGTPLRKRFFVDGKVYFPRKGTTGTAGRVHDRAMGLTGAGISYFLTDNTYVGIAAAGALTGGYAGYAEVTARPGYRFPLPGGAELAVESGIGAGGGGAVDTGGGLLTDVAAVARYPLGSGFSAAARGGYAWAPEGSLRGAELGLQVAYDGGTGRGEPARWRLRGGLQRYAAGKIRAPSGSDRAVDLLGVKIDRMVGDRGFLTGQALSAFSGGSGGYSAGLLGGGWTIPLWKDSPLFAEVELAAGAAGGGGVSSGTGFILQPSATLGWMFSEELGITASGGFVKAPSGDLRAAVAEAGLVWRFTTRD